MFIMGPVSLLWEETKNCEEEFQNALKSSKSIFKLQDSRLCARGVIGSDGLPTDSCRGDSGGPLMRFDESKFRYESVGIVSFGSVRCDSSTPGVYARVSNFLPWIKDIVFQESPTSSTTIATTTEMTRDFLDD